MSLAILVLFFCVLPVAFWPGNTSYEAIKLTAWAVTVALLLMSVGWRWRGDKSLIWRGTSLLAAGLVLLLLGALSLVGAFNHSLVWQGLLLVLLWLVVAVAVSEIATSRERLLHLFRALMFGAVVTAIYGLLQIGGILPGAAWQHGLLPGISTLGNQNYLAGFLAVVLFPSLLLWRVGHRWQRVLAILASALVLVTIAVCRAAGPLLAVPAAGISLAGGWLLLAKHRSRWVPRWYAACLLGAALLAIGGASLALRQPSLDPDGRRLRPNPVRRIYNRNAGELRLTNWAVGWHMLQDRPWTGVGLNNYQVGWPRYRAALPVSLDENPWAVHAVRATKAHNEYLQLAAETGLLGVGVLIAGGIWMFLFLRRRWQQLADRGRREDFLLLAAGLNVAALHALVSFPAHLPATAATLALVCGGLTARYLDPAAGRLVPVRWHPVFSLLLGVTALLLAGGALREYRADLRQREGQALAAAGHFAAARDVLAKAIEGRFWPGVGWFYLGTSEAALGNGSGAEQALWRNLGTEPTYEAYLQLAELLRDRRDFASALKLLEVLDACEPTQSFRLNSLFLRATITLRQGEYGHARQLLDELLTISPGYHRAWIALGYLEVLMGNTDQATKCYRRGLLIIDDQLAQAHAYATGQFPPPDPHAAHSLGGRIWRLQQHRAAAAKALASLGEPVESSYINQTDDDDSEAQ